jgi:hypothetical protein
MIELLTMFFSLVAICFGTLLIVWLIMVILGKTGEKAE